MHTYTTSTLRGKPTVMTLAGLTTAALVSAVVPVLAGLAFLISLLRRRPLIAAAVRRWPWLTGHPGNPSRPLLNGLTAAWGIVMLAAGAVQGAAAITGGLTITSPAAFATRAAIALAAEAAMCVITIACLHHSPARSSIYSPQG